VALLCSTYTSPIGKINLIARGGILLSANLSTMAAAKRALDPEDRALGFSEVKSLPKITELLDEYFAGDVTAINSIDVRQPGAQFSQAAWRAMRKIRPGRVLTYAELAERAGSFAAVRAAGSACAKNAIVLVVPCHRIVKTGGALGNYAYGVGIKEWLLRHEGAL
jgi:methylated-DNA-[protein]-cysteine S-methyltransferase